MDMTTQPFGEPKPTRRGGQEDDFRSSTEGDAFRPGGSDSDE